MTCKRIIYFHNGSIGDFLMTLHLMENLHENDRSLQLIIAVPRHVDVCRELAQEYPFVTVVYANRFTAPFSLMRYATGGNCTVTPPTPGKIPLATKLTARVLTVFPKEQMVGFDDGSPFNKLLYNKLIPYDKDKQYYKVMHDAVQALGYDTKIPEPSFSFERDSDVYERLGIERDAFFVLHPFGSGPHRSILGDDLTQLVTELRQVSDDALILSGSADDYEHNKNVIEKLNEEGKVVSVAGKVSMRELATLLQDASLYIGVDTGVSHLAALLHTKSLVVAHGASTRGWLSLYNPEGVIVYRAKDTETVHTVSPKDNVSIPSTFDKVPVEEVIAAVKDRLAML